MLAQKAAGISGSSMEAKRASRGIIASIVASIH